MKHLGDICKINGAEIEPVDCITGGSPCQDLSIAGKRAGLAGERSGLFMEQVRIVKEMRERDRRNGRAGDMVRPRFLVWENVPGAFSSNEGGDFQAVLEEIIHIAEPTVSVPRFEGKWTKAGAIDGDGWSIAWRTHDAQYWGVPQRRRRISVVADFGGQSAGEILFERKSVSGHLAESGAARERLAGNAESGASYAVRIRGGCDGGGKGDPSPTLTAGDRHGVAYISGVDGYNGDLTGDVASTIGVNCGMSTGRNGVMELFANENGGMARDSILCAGFKAGQGAQAGGIGYSVEVSPTLTAASSGTNQTPAVVALDMTHACDVIRECGEQVPALQARMGTGGNQVPLTYQMQGFGDYRAGEVASSCKHRDFKDGTDLAITNMAVRRLTPMECERLQGFPDGWTDIGEWIDEEGRTHKQADSPRYKALGNSIALPFWYWMLCRMAEHLPEKATLGSLFDGIGGFPLCWESIHGKGTARWASEIEKFTIAVTKLRFPEES